MAGNFGGPQFQIGNIIRALGQPFTIVPLSAFVMAYSECFLALGVILLIGSAAIWLCKKTKAGGAAAAH
jgi:hypothetical protein